MARALGAWQRHGIDLNRAMERLATGRKINRASDDPSGSITSDTLGSDIKAVEKRIEGSTRELGYLAAKDGAHSALSDLLTDLQGLVVSAANRGAMSEGEQDALQGQAESIVSTINHLADTQEFNGQKVLDETHAHQLGKTTVSRKNADGSESDVSVSLADLANGGLLNLKTGDLSKAQEAIESAIGEVATNRGAIGARSRDVESKIRTSQAELENLSAARSQILDADYATEVSNLVRAQTLQQASLYMMQMLMESGRQQVIGLISGTTARR